jgi:hypothetical protein
MSVPDDTRPLPHGSTTSQDGEPLATPGPDGRPPVDASTDGDPAERPQPAAPDAPAPVTARPEAPLPTATAATRDPADPTVADELVAVAAPGKPDGEVDTRRPSLEH